MGRGDHLVAISTYDRGRPGIADLPAAGDYLTIDWELLAKLRPDVLIIQLDPQRTPAGVTDRARELQMRIVNCWPIDSLDQMYDRMSDLGAAVGDPAAAQALVQSTRARLDAVRKRSAGLPPVATLIATDDSGTALAGPGTFLDGLLSIAGGTNVAAPLGQLFPSPDPETLAGMRPQVIVLLLPGATPQVVVKARAAWQRYADMPAVKSGRIVTMTQDYLLLPGPHVADVAEAFAAALRPGGPSATAPFQPGSQP